MSSVAAFQAIRTVGVVLPAEALSRAVDLLMPGQTPSDYQLTPGMTINAAAARAWDAALGAHRAWTQALQRLPPADPATALTRDRWLLPLLYELGWGRPTTLNGGLDVAPGLGETAGPHFPISHRLSWPAENDPQIWATLQLVGAGISLDTKTPGVTARAPQSMLQDYLNREDRSLWGIVSNGHLLRVLRDASALTKQSYLEFDLDDIFANQRYADFRLFFLTAHASRFAPHADTAPTTTAQDTDSGEDADERPDELPTLRHETCWLEQWRTAAIADGARALLTLQHGVAAALQHLGDGFISHPGNTELREILAQTPDAGKDLHRALLRIAYRLIVLFVAEDRGLLQPTDIPAAAQALYDDYFSTRRLRTLAATRTGTGHTDLWEAHLLVTDALAGNGLGALGLNGLGATLFSRDNLSVLSTAQLPNRNLLAAVRALSQITDQASGIPRSVDYRNLDSEELGGMYEGLLAYTPRYDPDARTFQLTLAAGNDRKTSGSYYTPTALISLVLDEALDPLIAEATIAPDPEAALLALTVLDPAVGSGHFVVAAARRIAAALATIRTGDTEPGPSQIRQAIADVVERCLYGVDLNDLAIEITKVALWLEAFNATRPFPFLDAHFKVGDALLGVTPELLRHNIPDIAFTVLRGDDPGWTKKLKARNKSERTSGDHLQLGFGDLVETRKFTQAATAAEAGRTGTLAQVRQRADAWRNLEADPELVNAKLVADAWCAAYVQSKTPDHGQGITYGVLRDLAADPASSPVSLIARVRDLARQYRFFHWHLEFPGIFTTAETHGDGTGWSGGFSCVVGNPPWERVKIQDKEFFANVGRTDIVEANTAAIRGRMIAALEEDNPALFKAYQSALRQSEGTSHLLLRGGRYPLTGQGDVNTYSVFAETMRTLTGERGAAGIITPTGLATDKTTSPFFADSLSHRRLLAFYDFENEGKIFPGVHHSFRFAVTVMTGALRTAPRSRFAFYTRYLADVLSRRFALTADEVLIMNPNTGTLPMFRTRIDADITLGIYQRHPVLIADGKTNGNSWNLTFGTMFHMANDSNLFIQPEDLTDASFNGWSYERDGQEFVPLYEAKMLSHFDHRFSTYQDATQAQLNVGSLPRPTTAQHDDPDLEPLARYWVKKTDVAKAFGEKWDREWFLGWRDIARASDSRTFVPSAMPASAVGNKFPVVFPAEALNGPLLHAVWSTIVFDYIARQKLSGTGMTYFIVKQLACPSPAVYASDPPWTNDCTLAEWILPYVLELSYTSWRLKPYAQEMGDGEPPFHWDPDRRALLRADLEAAFLHIYGLTRPEAEHLLDSFPVVRRYEERDLGEYRTRRLALEAYDRMEAAARLGGTGWTPLADQPAGQGPRHEQKSHV